MKSITTLLLAFAVMGNFSTALVAQSYTLPSAAIPGDHSPANSERYTILDGTAVAPYEGYIAVPKLDKNDDTELLGLAKEGSYLSIEKEKYNPPVHLLGAIFGLGFQDAAGAFLLCLGFEYLRLLNMNFLSAASFWYLGAFLTWDYLNNDNGSRSLFSLGAKFQNHLPILAWGSTMLVNGLMAAWLFGNEDFNSFEGDLNGFRMAYFIGLQLMLTPVLALGVQMAVISYQTLKFEGEFGNDDRQNEFDFLLNKNNPLTLILRWSLF